MRKSFPTLRDLPRSFSPTELFFSTTDRKGIITSCNDVFARISAYSADELLGEPHNKIRHPHMPRSVFKLFWDYLLAGNPVGAYVKNLAKNGEYYWVYALAAPCEDGFLSVRLKPTSPYLEAVSSLYRELVELEDRHSDWREGMAASGKLLVERLRALGFENYDQFMSETLRTEVESYCDAKAALPANAGLPENSLISIFRNQKELMKLREDLAAEQSFVTQLDLVLSRMSLNAGVRATRLGESGRAIRPIGIEIMRLSHEIAREAKMVSSALDKLKCALGTSSFFVSLTLLQIEMDGYFTEEMNMLGLSDTEQKLRFGKSAEVIGAMLRDCAAGSAASAASQVEVLQQCMTQFEYFVTFISKVLQTIQFAYVTGKTECARIEGGSTFAELLVEILQVSEDARGRLGKLATSVSAAHRAVSNWRLGELHINGGVESSDKPQAGAGDHAPAS